jgi:hypothetical protein
LKPTIAVLKQVKDVFVRTLPLLKPKSVFFTKVCVSSNRKLALSKQKKVRLSKSEPVLKPRSVLLKHEKARRRTLFETENHPSVYLSKPKSCPFESRETQLLLNFVVFKKPKITLTEGLFLKTLLFLKPKITCFVTQNTTLYKTANFLKPKVAS